MEEEGIAYKSITFHSYTIWEWGAHVHGSRTLRVAIAGCHRSLTRVAGSHNWATAFAREPRTRVVSVFDKGAEARQGFVETWKETWPGVAVYDDFERMLAEQAPDIVCIATRQTMHADQIEAAVKAGARGILCDKPLATSLEEMDRIVTACAEVPLAFGLDRRWSEPYRFIRKEIANGLIGRVHEVIGFGTPNLINHGCHWYDAMLMLAGDPQPLWVSGFVDGAGEGSAVTDEKPDPKGRAQIGLAGDIAAYVTPTAAGGVSFELIGDEGRLWVLDDAREVFRWSPPSRDGRSAAVMERVEVPTPEPEWPAGLAIVRDLVAAVESGGRTACDIDQARWATEIGFGVHLSSEERGERVTLPARSRTLRVESLPWGNE